MSGWYSDYAAYLECGHFWVAVYPEACDCCKLECRCGAQNSVTVHPEDMETMNA